MESGGKQKHPIFNGQWEILSSLGEGNTSKVYMARNLENGQTVALKLLREEFLQRDADSIKSVEQEIQILQGLKHDNIVNIVGYGSDGTVLKPSGRKIENLVYILLEYVSGGLLFDLCQTMGGMGEDYGRFFLAQMMEVVGYMQGKGVVHRDLKLENILVDDMMNLKVADFGFATYKKITKLQSYRGTMTYMAPEIKEGKTYDGKQIDMFSVGVILFIIIQGIFPFKEAKKDEYFYNLIINNKLDTYWSKVGGQSLSPEFKDLILKMFSYDGSKRPTVDEIKAHPWMTGKAVDIKGIRSDLVERLSASRSEKTAASSNADGSRRAGKGADQRLALVREVSESTQKNYVFNDKTDFITQCDPGYIVEQIETFNVEQCNSELTIQINDEKQWVKIMKGENGQDLTVKVKFFKVVKSTEEAKDEDGEEEEPTYRIKFTKKRGDIMTWYEMQKTLNETTLEDSIIEHAAATQEVEVVAAE